MSIKYFLSGASSIWPEHLPDVASLIDYRLLSMHKGFRGNTRIWCEASHHAKSSMQEVMLDSGAFTAFTKGHEVVMSELVASYDDTVRRLNPKLKIWFINLDVIPGTKRGGVLVGLNQALDESEKNYKSLKKRYGSRVIPVYHRTEGESQLMEIASLNDYIGIGFGPKTSEEYRVQHAEEVLSILEPMGKKVHGLATTGYRMLNRAPFDSVDSATWLYIAAMGGIMYLDDQGDIANLAISASSPKQRELRQHFNTLSGDEQTLVLSRLKDAGVTLEQVQGKAGESLGDLSYRILFNAHQMREWLRTYKRPKVKAEKGLFPI